MGSIPILTVCTGNICRSPVAAEALKRHLGARGVNVSVRSTGTMGGVSSDSSMIKAARGVGYDISSHVSRPLDLNEIVQARLVLAMDRGHIEQVVAAHPDAWAKTFTLPELVRRAAALPSGTKVETVADWLAKVGEGRTASDLLAGPSTDDVEDPHGRSMGKYKATAKRIDHLVADLSDLMVSQIDEIATNRGF